MKFLALILIFFVSINNCQTNELDDTQGLGWGIILIIIVVILSLLLCFIGSFLQNSLVYFLLGCIAPIILFLILHFWPKDLENQVDEKNQLKDYNIVVRWIFWTIMFVTFLMCLMYKINEFFFATQITQRLPPAKALNIKKTINQLQS